MRVKTIVEEWFNDYKKPSMFLFTISCTGKCYRDFNLPPTICQNLEWSGKPTIGYPDQDLFDMYISNKMTSAFVIGGLEPFDRYSDLSDFIHCVRVTNKCDDDIVIYTGYEKCEVSEKIHSLSKYKNIIVKFGRYMPNGKPCYNDILGVELASENQYVERI